MEKTRHNDAPKHKASSLALHEAKVIYDWVKHHIHDAVEHRGLHSSGWGW